MLFSPLPGVRRVMAWVSLGLCLASPSWAGECNCAATTERDDSQRVWTLNLQFESMSMGTLLQGSSPVDPDQVIRSALSTPGRKSFSVPTSMTMQRSTLRARYRLDEETSLILSIPFSVSNLMDMRMGMNPMAMGMNSMAMGKPAMAMPMMAGPSYRDMTMSPIQQLGDIVLTVQHDLFRDESGNSLSVAGGLKLPTGESEVRTAQGNLVHAMMQPGTGSLDLSMGLFGRAYLGGGPDGKTWTLEPGLSYQINGTNRLGYRFGNRLGYDVAVGCRLGEDFSVSTALNGIVTGRDSQNGTLDPRTGTTAYQNPATSLVDNVDNTGGSFLYVAPGFQWKLGEDVTLRAHHRIPLSRSVNGTQIVTDGWSTLNLSVGF